MENLLITLLLSGILRESQLRLYQGIVLHNTEVADKMQLNEGSDQEQSVDIFTDGESDRLHSV